MSNPYFSVIIPFYNKEKSLEACIESLLLQDFPKDNYELITVNNNSTDNSLAIIKKYPQIQVIHEALQNPYAARNTGILHAAGSVMVFTDADVEVRPDWLSRIHQAIEKNGYDILIGWYMPARPIKLLQIHGLLISERIQRALRQNDPSMLTACAANLIIKKEIFLKENLFQNTSNSEDMYFTIRCLKKGYRVGFDENIGIKRNDIDSIGIFLLKNFIYGCSNARDIKLNLSFAGKLKYIFITIKFVFKYFPVGVGLLLITFFYFSGYFLSKIKVLSPRSVSILVHKYTVFTTKIAA